MQCAFPVITTITLWQLMHLLVPMNQKVLNKLSCYKAIVVITGRAHCFLDCIYITRIIRL